MKPIILATDGSPSAAEATLAAVELARALDVPVLAIAVEHVEIPAYAYFGYGDVLRELKKIVDEHLDETLAQVAAVAAEHGVMCELSHEHGNVVEKVCALARHTGAQMIVVGAHGWGPVRRAVNGSVSTALVHTAPCPVLVVPSRYEHPADEAAALVEEVVR